MRKLTAIFFSVIVLVAAAQEALAQRRSISLIRDAETENIIRDFAAPVLEAAGLDPLAVSVHIIGDPSINAFVAGGQRIFVHTGLLLKVRNPGELKGVLAHEIGHIAGGHLARLQDELRSATTQAIISMLLGLAAAASGQPGAGSAIMLGGQSMAQRSLLQYSRTQESAADQAAVTFLDRSGQSSAGLVSFLQLLGEQESLLSSRQDPYARTHPISAERVEALRTRLNQSPYTNRPDPPESVERLKIVQAKVAAFLDPPALTLNRLREDNSFVGRLAKAVAYYRMPNLERAVPVIDALIAERPGDPFLHELKSQMLFENGRVAEALAPALEAVRLAPNEALLRLALGQVQVTLEGEEHLAAAVRNLEQVVRREPESQNAWRHLAIAYGRSGNRGMASYASAERFFIEGNLRDARGQAAIALRLLPAGSPNWLRAQDISIAVEREESERRERR